MESEDEKERKNDKHREGYRINEVYIVEGKSEGRIIKVDENRDKSESYEKFFFVLSSTINFQGEATHTLSLLPTQKRKFPKRQNKNISSFLDYDMADVVRHRVVSIGG